MSETEFDGSVDHHVNNGEDKHALERIFKLEGDVESLSDMKKDVLLAVSKCNNIDPLNQRVDTIEKNISMNPVNCELKDSLEKLEALCNKNSEEITALKNTVSSLSAKIEQLEKAGEQRGKPQKPPSSNLASARPSKAEVPKPAPSRKPPARNTSSMASKTTNSAMKTSPTHSKGDGTIKTFLRGRPIVHYLPSSVRDTYDITQRLEAPEDLLKLEWVYGYRGKDCRDNIVLLETGEVCYFIAAVVVLFNAETHSQRHYLGHTDDIKSLALHSDRITVASGQVAGHEKKEGKAHVRIWNSITLETLHVLGLGDFERAVCTIAFSKANGGEWLAVVDEANDHFLSVWDWKQGKKLLETKSSGDPVVSLEWSPVESNAFATCGKNHLVFWTVDSGSLSKKSGLYEKFEKPKVTICMKYTLEGNLLTGDSSGNVFLWKAGSNKISHACSNAHEGGVFSLAICADGSILSGGGKDRRIVQYRDESLEPSGAALEIPEWFGACRAIVPVQDSGALFIGTTKNCLLHSAGLSSGECSALVQGQFEEFWGLAAHPSTHQFLSAGTDCQVIMWDALARKPLWSSKVQFQITCADFFPQPASEAPVVAMGAGNGKWLVMDCLKHEVIAVHSDGGSEAIQCIAFSPDGKLLAVGSRNNFVYLYQVSEAGKRFSRVGKCVGHSSFILHLDWSCDSTLIRTQSGDYEVLFWSATSAKQVTTTHVPELYDTNWATHTVCLGWDVVGIWPEDADGTDINTCARSNPEGGKQLLATGDDSGRVKLFSYPSCQPLAKFKEYVGHSSHVTEVRFLYDNSRLITAGGKDSAVLQWAVGPSA